MNGRPDRLAAFVGGWTVLTVVAGVAGAPGWVRAVTAVPFMLVIAGLGWAAAFARERAMVVAVSIAVSISTAMLVGEAMALADQWSPGLGIVALALVALAGAAVHWVRRAT